MSTRVDASRARSRAGAAPSRQAAEVSADTSGEAVDLVVRQRRAIEAVLRRHRVPATEAAALVAAAAVAALTEDRPPAAAGNVAEGRLVRALELACARRGGSPQGVPAEGHAAADAEAAAPPAAPPPRDTAAAPPAAALGPSFAARLAATLPDGAPSPPCERAAVDSGAAEGAGAAAASRAEADTLFASVVESVAQRSRDLRDRLAAERRDAPALTAAALAAPAAADAASIATRGAAEHLLAAATAAWVEDARRARELAALALAVVRRLDPEVYGAASLADLEAQALATLANAARVSSDLAAADAGLAEAGRVLASGSRDPRSRAYLLRLQATLRSTQGRPAEALRLLDQAVAIYRWLGDAHHQGRTLLQRARLVGENDPRQAAALARQALDTIDLRREPRLELVALHNLAIYHHRAGELERAAALLPRVRAVARRTGGRLDRLRMRWLAAQIAADRGEEHAAGELAAVRDAFVANGMALDAILASLDLAALQLSRGRSDETRRLAEDLVPLVSAHRLDRQVLATLLVFQQAARGDRATLALVRSTATTLRRARPHPRPSPPPS